MHPQSGPHPEIRPQHLPPVLQGEEPGYWVHEGESSLLCSPTDFWFGGVLWRWIVAMQEGGGR